MAIKVLDSQYKCSYVKFSQLPKAMQGQPEIVLLGRSNVGKSSFINRLVNKKNLARTSNTPGKTRMMNFYEVQVDGGGTYGHKTLHLIDLPGYGYAKVSKTEQEHWRKEFERLLDERDSIGLYFQLIDARHGYQPNDWQMWQWFSARHIIPLVLLTKMDKLKQNDKAKIVAATKEKTGLTPEWLIPFSAETGQGVTEAWQQIMARLFAAAPL